MRRRLYIAGGIIGVLVVLVSALVLQLPAERIGAFAAAKASAALDREVTVQRIGVRLFPRLAISMEGVTVAGATPSDSVLASAARVELRPRIMPLLRRSVVIDEIAFEQPLLRIEIAADSTLNLPTFESGDTAAGGDAELDIRKLRVNDGTVVYRDATNGTAVRVAGIAQTLTLSGSIGSGELTRIAAAGDLVLDDIDVDAPALLAWPVRDLRLRIIHEVDVDRAADRIDLTRLSLAIQELELDVEGSITSFTDSLERTVDLRARTGNTDVASLIASLPKTLLEDASGEALSGAAGVVQLDVAASGRAGAGSGPAVSGVLTLEDAAIARGRYGTIADQLDGRVTFSLDSVASDGITGRVLGEPLAVAFIVRDPATPHGSVNVTGALALDQAQKLGLLPDSVQSTGRVAVDIAAEGSLVEPAEALIEGTVDLDGVRVALVPLKQPVVIGHGRIVLDGRNAVAEDVRATIGSSDVAVDVNASEWLPYALGDTLRPPTITFDARSALFDADEILGARPDTYTYGQLFVARLGDRQLDGRSATQIAEEIGLGMPDVPPIILDGRVRATRFVRGAFPLNDVDVTIAARGGELDVQAASFRMMGGGVHMTGRLGLAAAGAAAQPLVLDYTVNDVAAATFLERFTGFRDHISGDLLVTGTMNMLLDEHLLPVRETVSGAGTLAVLEGEIINWPLLRRIGDRIGIAEFDTLAFQDWSGRYRITGPTIVLEESSLQSGDVAVRAAGSFDVNGTLDIGGTLYVPQEWAARVPGAPAGFIASAAAGDDGRVPIGARFTGTARDPSVSIDMSEAGARIASAARDAAEQQARAAAERAAEQIGLPPRDSIAAAADSLKKKAEAEVVNRLRRILRPDTTSSELRSDDR